MYDEVRKSYVRMADKLHWICVVYCSATLLTSSNRSHSFEALELSIDYLVHTSRSTDEQ